GLKASSTDALGTHHFQYNNAGQLISNTVSGGILDGMELDYSFDSLLRQEGYSLSLGSDTASAFYSHDDASRLASVSSGNLAVNYTYAANSSLIDTIRYQNGIEEIMLTTKVHDKLNRLISTTSVDKNNEVISSFNLTYNSASQRVRVGEANGQYWLYEYDSLGQITKAQKYHGDNTPVDGQKFEYSHDDIGNRTQTKTNDRTADYTSNSVNQYTQRDVPGYLAVLGSTDSGTTVDINSVAADRKDDYYHRELTVANSSVDALEDITIDYTTNATTTTHATNAFVPADPESFTYDDDGNQTQDGRFNYTWNGENRLIRAQTRGDLSSEVAIQRIDFAYDHQGRRFQKKVYTDHGSGFVLDYERRYIYDGWNLIAELDGSNNLVKRYLWGLDLSGSLQGAGGVGGLLAMEVVAGTNSISAGNSYFFSYDGNGNPVLLVNTTTGKVDQRYAYSPFGQQLLSASGDVDNDFLFSTKYRDCETGLIYYGYRYYSAEMGRWLNRDPIEGEGGLNLYGFVGNDPIGQIDVLGFYRLSFPGLIWYFYEEKRQNIENIFYGLRTEILFDVNEVSAMPASADCNKYAKAFLLSNLELIKDELWNDELLGIIYVNPLITADGAAIRFTNYILTNFGNIDRTTLFHEITHVAINSSDATSADTLWSYSALFLDDFDWDTIVRHDARYLKRIKACCEVDP
ncbi:MAG: RHS repeat-associated core domain-containing protein, partial [Planctomycetes bacterium]|nr:RHS repeat-associated core domain-containing protein [Planctomycetota bacterium]